MAERTDSGVIGAFKGYPFQVVPIQSSDLLLVHVADTLDLDDCNHLVKELKKDFPNNTVILLNKHILQGITVLRHENILEGYQNDFLH
jgi:short-subunit dehydrogenase involved in D-alanine esterification of teichoic acids